MTADATRPSTSAGSQIVVAIALVLPTLITLVYFVWLAGESSGWQQAAYSVGKAVQFLLPVAWVGIVLRERIWPRSFQSKGVVLGIAFGIAVVAAMCALYFLALRPLGLFVDASAQIIEKVRGFQLTSPAAYAGLSVFYAVVHSGLEEYYWRWFVFGQMCRFRSPTSAAIVSSLGFMAHHVVLLGTFFGWASPLTYVLSASVAVGGLFWAWLYRNSDSIYAPWVSHLIVDAGIFLVGYDVVGEILV